MKSKLIFILICGIGLLSCKEETPKSQTQESQKSNTKQPSNSPSKASPSNDEKSGISQRSTLPDVNMNDENKIAFYREKGNYKTAIQLVDDCIKKDENNQRLWSIKAMLHFEVDDTMKAIQCYEKAIEMIPVAEDRLNLAQLYAGKANIKSIQMVEELSKAGKGSLNPKLNFIRGTYYNSIGKKELAISYLDKAIYDNYTFMDAYREKALMLCDLKRYPEAVNTLIRAVTLQNSYEEGYYYLGQCYEKMGEIRKAIESYQTALMYDSRDQDAADALNRLTKE